MISAALAILASLFLIGTPICWIIMGVYDFTHRHRRHRIH
jgi:hypothetical protein